MAFPWIFDDNFESGTNSGWDSETDTGSRLNIRHYTYLAKQDASLVGPIAPYRGAYCAEWDLGDTNDHVLIEGDIDIADGSTATVAFYLFIGNDFTATADDDFNIFEFQQAAGTNEGSIGLRIIAATNVVSIGIGDGTAPSSYVPLSPQRGKWIHVAATYKCSTTAVGTFTLFLDGAQVIALTTLTNAAAIGRGVLGTQDTLSTTTGHIYMDQFIFDDLRIYPFKDRYPEQLTIYKSQHIALGESEVLNLTLAQGAGTDNAVKLWDTDKGETTDEFGYVAHLYNLTASEPPIDLADVPMNFKRGVYAQVSGTSPKVLIHIGKSQGYYSAGRIRQHGNSN